MIWTEKDIRKVLNEVANKKGVPCNHIPIKFVDEKEINYLNACFRYRQKTITKEYLGPVDFIFNRQVFNGVYVDEILKEIIIHEYIHYYCHETYTEDVGHGHIFKKHCKELGISPFAKIRYYPGPEKIKVYKYEIYCPKCNKILGVRDRMSKGVEYFEKNCFCDCGTFVKVHKVF